MMTTETELLRDPSSVRKGRSWKQYDRTQTGARAPGGLSQRQEAFCLAFIETGNASEAYRRSYKPKRMSAKSVHEKASHILAEGKVQARVAELRESAAKQAGVTLQAHLEKLADLRDKAAAAADYDAAIRAEKHRGEASGLYPDRGKAISLSFPLQAKSEPVSETAQWVADLTKGK